MNNLKQKPSPKFVNGRQINQDRINLKRFQPLRNKKKKLKLIQF